MIVALGGSIRLNRGMGLNPSFRQPEGKKPLPFELLGVKNIFPIPLWQYRMAGFEALNAQLLDEIEKRRNSETALDERGTRRGWQSQRDLFARKEAGHGQLTEALRAMMLHAVGTMVQPGALRMLHFNANGWVNVNPPGGYNAPHVHPSALLSGVYYVNVPETGENPVGGAIEFNVPHEIMRVAGIPVMDMLQERVQIRPEPGLVLLFPGTLSHWVHPNDSEEDRVTIAFNLVVSPKRPR